MALKWKKKGNEEAEMSFLEHLEELRWHIIRSLLAIVIFMIIAFIFKNFLFDTIILAPKRPDFFTNRLLCRLGHATIWGHTFNSQALCINTKPLNLISIKMAGQLTTHITVAAIAGLILAFPFVIREFWNFFRPALKSNEASHAKTAVFATSILFFIGVVFGYYVLSPLSIHFLSSYEISPDVVNQLTGLALSGYLVVFGIEALMLFAATLMLTRIDVQKFQKNIEEPSFVEKVTLASD